MADEIEYGRIDDCELLESFLRCMDNEFPLPLSSKCDLGEYSRKLVDEGCVEGAWAAGELVGVLAGYMNNLQTREAYISVLVVSKAFRGRRISSSLLERFVHDAREEGMQTIRVFTFHTNDAAHGLYVSHGFEEVAFEPHGDYELVKQIEGI